MAKVLVIDDAASVLAWVAQTLAAAGHEVCTADCGRKGILLLRQQPVDLVITDLYMPDEDGFDVMQSVRRLAPHIRFIVMSGKSLKQELFAAAKALGAVRTLAKPFQAEQLLEAVQAALATPQQIRSSTPQAPAQSRAVAQSPLVA